MIRGTRLSAPVITFAVLLTWVAMPAFSAPQVVYVAQTNFPPYFIVEGESVSGLGPELMQLMNAFQDKYVFRGYTTSSMRRHSAFMDGRYDLSMFDHRQWGWTELPVDSTQVYLRGGEKYVALAKLGRAQSYFADFQGKRLAGYLGYHYQLTHFENDQQLLRTTYNMELSSTHEGNINKLTRDRADIAVITQAYLGRWLLLHPAYKNTFLVSEQWDQQYNFVMLIRKGINPTAEELNTLLNSMDSAGLLQPLWQKYGVELNRP